MVWSETRNHDYLGVMRKIRDGLEAEQFRGFTDLVNFFTVPQYRLTVNVEGDAIVAEGAVIEGSRVGDIAAVVIKDSMISIPRSDLPIPESQRREQITEKFYTTA